MSHLPIVLRATPAPRHAVRTGSRARLRVTIDALLSLLMRWQARHEQRRALAALDDRLLADVGLTPAQARREARRPFWR